MYAIEVYDNEIKIGYVLNGLGKKCLFENAAQAQLFINIMYPEFPPEEMMIVEDNTVKADYEKWDAGGGFEVLRKDMPNGKYFIATIAGDCDLPVKGQPADLGYYDRDKQVSMRRIIWNK